ncbi:DUF4352 domain-containing protein [Dactylosporangium sp. CA-139114]|uniref:DUF4352 domain-containing protein n=1 Tax=Dactylosporangium sp. CA-139114 TaxID=3239931 RepID=UPI003D991F3F
MRTKFVALLAIPLAAFVLACGATGSSTSAGGGGGDVKQQGASEKKAPATVKAGEVMTLTESILGQTTVVEITLTNVKPNAKSGNQFSKPGKGQFVTADVSVLVKQGKYTINSSSFKFIGADSTAYDSTIGLDGKDLSANDLAAGQKTSGTVWFDVAKGAEAGGKIALKSYLADGDAGYWTL